MLQNETLAEYELSPKVRKHLGEAVARWKMINSGDRILVGLSGGKDSAVLLVGLTRLMARSPISFTVAACTLDPTGGLLDTSPLETFCRDLGVPLFIERHPLFDIMKARNTEAPCSFCANMRRGILSTTARREGYGTLALGHHLDDAVETALLNLFQAGRFRSFQPVMWQDRTRLWVIRPMVTTPEELIIRETERLKIPLCSPDCPFELQSRRLAVRDLIRQRPDDLTNLRGSVLHALTVMEGADSWAPQSAHLIP